jgi:anti-sigma B factor antagonist
MSFNYQIAKDNGLAILNMDGKLVDKAEAVEISVEIDEELAEGTSKFVIDLSRLEYMNSTGLNILINLMNKSRNAGGEAVIVGVKPRIMALFAVTKLNSVFTMRDTLQEAIAFFDHTAS